MQNVREFGAVGDGITLDTAAIQNAIDAGGTVLVPKGIYRTGTLYLKSNGGLHLEAGAVLLASHEREDYNADDYVPQNAVFKEEQVTGAHLISAVEQENIFISGNGCISGEGHYWMNESNLIPGTEQYEANPDRPGQMIFLCECKNVHISDVTIKDSPYWHLFLHGCEDAVISGVTVKGDRTRWTNDGIDLDCCARVTVSNCNIDVGDDAFTLRAWGKKLLHRKAVCEDITVTNCIFNSFEDYGIRIGVGDGIIRNCLFSNISIEAHGIGGVGIQSKFSPTSDGVCIENIIMNNLIVKAGVPFDIRLANSDDQPPFTSERFIRNISIENAVVKAKMNSNVNGFINGEISGIHFKDVNVIYEPEFFVSNIWHHGNKKCAFHLYKANDTVFENVKVSCEESDWESDIMLCNSKEPTVQNCKFTKGIHRYK